MCICMYMYIGQGGAGNSGNQGDGSNSGDQGGGSNSGDQGGAGNSGGVGGWAFVAFSRTPSLATMATGIC